MPNDSPAPWVSIRAVTWALDEAPDVPPSLLSVLVSLARHSDESGRGAWLSRHRLSWNSRKAEQQVKRDLKQLRDLGLIRPGDQQLVAHLPADKRPTVYDLAIEKQRAPYEPPSGGLTGTPVHRGASQDPSRGASQGQAGGLTGQSGGPSKDPKEGIEDDDEKDRSARASAHRIVADATDAVDDEINDFITWLNERYKPKSVNGYLRRLAGNGHLRGRLGEWRQSTRQADRPEPATDPPPSPSEPDRPCPCGQPDGANLLPTGQVRCYVCRDHVGACQADPLFCPDCQDIRAAAGLPADPRNPDLDEPEPGPEQEPDADNVTQLSSRLPECPHCVPGGTYRRDDGRLICGMCHTHETNCRIGPEKCKKCRTIADAPQAARLSDTA